MEERPLKAPIMLFRIRAHSTRPLPSPVPISGHTCRYESGQTTEKQPSSGSSCPFACLEPKGSHQGVRPPGCETLTEIAPDWPGNDSGNWKDRSSTRKLSPDQLWDVDHRSAALSTRVWAARVLTGPMSARVLPRPAVHRAWRDTDMYSSAIL